MIKEFWLIRFLKKIGLIKTYEINKNEMCKSARSVCNMDCESCAWNTRV